MTKLHWLYFLACRGLGKDFTLAQAIERGLSCPDILSMMIIGNSTIQPYFLEGILQKCPYNFLDDAMKVNKNSQGEDENVDNALTSPKK